MKRFEERLEDLTNATNRLNEALQEEDTDLAVDGVLHRFEFTFELAWKTMKDYLEYQGLIDKTGSPRGVIQEAFSNGIIENGQVWIDMMLARNTLSHLYDEETSREIYDDIKNLYISEINKLVDELSQNKIQK